MRRTVLFTVIILVALGAIPAQAARKDEVKQKAVSPKEAAKQEAGKNKEADKAAELLAKKKAELNNTEWTISLTPMSGKGNQETDVLRFAEEKVISQNLEKLGYNPTSFTTRLQDDETLTWETMQSSEKDGAAFWRGDCKEGIMRGVLSKRGLKGSVTDYSFTSASSVTMSSEQVKEVVEKEKTYRQTLQSKEEAQREDVIKQRLEKEEKERAAKEAKEKAETETKGKAEKDKKAAKETAKEAKKTAPAAAQTAEPAEQAADQVKQ